MRRSCQPAILADTGVSETGLVEQAAGFTHTLETPIERMIVRPRDDAEPHRTQVLRDRRYAGVGPIAIPGIGSAREIARIKEGSLEIPIHHVGALEHVEHGFEAGKPARILAQGTRNDQISDGTHRETVRNIRLQFVTDRPLRIEVPRILDHGIGCAIDPGLLRRGLIGADRHRE